MKSNIAQRWADDVSEIEAESYWLYEQAHFVICHEDLFAPFEKMTRLWCFLDVNVDSSLESTLRTEMASNQDEEAGRPQLGDCLLPAQESGWQLAETVPCAQ